MKKLFLFFLPTLFFSIAHAQNTDIDVKVITPKMRDLINRIWVRLPNGDCMTLPSFVVDQSNNEPCSALALWRFRYRLTVWDIGDGLKDAIKTEFKLVKLIPAGKVTSYAIDVADLVAKALTANSPADFASDLGSFGFGKIVADNVTDKLKDLLGDDALTGTTENLAKLYFDEVWNLAKTSIMGDGEPYTRQATGDCTDNIRISIEPYDGDDRRIFARLVYSIDGDCNCNVTCRGAPGLRLKTWNVHGEMPLLIESAETTEDGYLWWKKPALHIVLRAGDPTYLVQADCNCPQNSSVSSDASYEQKSASDLFAGAGLISEDAGKRFSLFGVNVAYTKEITSPVGLTADGGIYFRKQDMVSYRRIQGLVGPSFTPAQKASFVFRPHILAGVANTRSKFEGTENSFSTTSFAAAVGTDLIIKKQRTGVEVRVDYNPVFPRGGAIHNVRFGVGIRF
jgi:hypothetical protein